MVLLVFLGVVYVQQKFMIIGIGGVIGVYYVVGGVICCLVNKDCVKYGFCCLVEFMGGFVVNINIIKVGEFDFGVLQLDVQYNVFNGIKQFEKDGKYIDLCVVFFIYFEFFIVFLCKEVNIVKFDDLKGKCFNIGNFGLGICVVMDELFIVMGWKIFDFGLVVEFKVDEYGVVLCDNKIDVFFYGVGYFSVNIQDLIIICGVKLVFLIGLVVDKLVKVNSYYVKVNIFGGLYVGYLNLMFIYGVFVLFVILFKVFDVVVYELVKVVFENFEEFKKLYFVFVVFDFKSMIKDGLLVLLYFGVVKYYKEKGWM